MNFNIPFAALPDLSARIMRNALVGELNLPEKILDAFHHCRRCYRFRVLNGADKTIDTDLHVTSG